MRIPIGYSILLVLLLGLLCVSPISSYYYEDSIQPTDSSPVAVVQATSTGESRPSQQETSGSSNNNNNNNNSDSVVASEIELAAPSSSLAGVEDEEGESPQNEKRDFGTPGPQQQSQQQQPSQDDRNQEQANANSGDEANSPNSAGQLSEPVNPPLKTVSAVAADNVRQGEGAAKEPASRMASSNSARSFGADIVAPQAAPEQGRQLQGAPSMVIPSDVPQDHLPTIIENNKPVDLQQQHQQQQQSLQQHQQQLQQQQGSTGLISANQTLEGTSTARTFGEGWTNCMGVSSSKYGTCKNDVECKKSKGYSDGSCMGGLGACCVMALTCGDKSTENNTFFANPDFPEPSWEARLCEVEIKKKHKKILQVMIEFEEFELAPPNQDGECITDVFQVKLASAKPSPYSLLRICGQNTGQHMYLDVSQIDEPIVLSMATSGGGYPRRWSIRIVQMDDKNNLLAPPGCLQYYTDTIGHFRSFNLGRNLRNLYYAICFRIDNGYSGIRFTSNFFGMNGPGCRRIGGPPKYLPGGRYNHTNIEAHPHHLVIPPPGYAPPPPKPPHHLPPPPPPPRHHHHQPPPPPLPPPPHSYQTSPPPEPAYSQNAPGSLPIRYKRLAYSQPSGERVPRTFGSSTSDLEAKEFKKDEKKHHEVYPSPPPPAYYGGPPPPTYGPAAYGPPPPPGPYGGYQQEYPQYYHESKADKKDEKWFDKWSKQSSDKTKSSWEEENKKSWWQEQKFWKTEKKDDKKEDKYGWKSDKDEEKYGYSEYSSNYGPPSYAPGYGGYGPPPPGYGPPPPPPGYGPPAHGAYGPSAYGHHAPSGYGGGYNSGYGGDYHYKEIDKFGKKYEHLEYKQEKNHLDKEAKKDEKSWWWWNNKDDKKDKKDKKEKFFTHHEALFPMMHIPEMPHCEPRFCGQNDVITFPPSGDSISEMCGNRFNRGRGPKIISGSPLVVYVSNRGQSRGAGFDMNYEQVFYIPRPY